MMGLNKDSLADDSGWLRILIADDAQATRRSTRLMFSQIPETRVVAMAQDGTEAVSLTQAMQPDIALVDVNMPDMNGLTAIQEMMGCLPELACIVISVERDRKTLHRAMEVGARGYLIKPFTIEQLEKTIDNVRLTVQKNKARADMIAQLQIQRDDYLQQLANEYIKARRTDATAMKVFEQLAKNANCRPRYLKTLAIIYVFRSEWGKLAELSDRLAK